MTIEALVARYGVAAIFLGAGFEGEMAVVTGGVLAHQGLVPLWAAMAAAVAGSFAADQLFFAGGRYFRNSRPVRRFRARPTYAKAMRLLERHPRGFIFAYRFIYGIRTASPIAIGASRVPARLFFAVNLLAAAIWGVAFSAVGYLFGNGLERLVGRIGLRHLLPALIVGAALAAAAWLAWRWWRNREGAAA